MEGLPFSSKMCDRGSENKGVGAAEAFKSVSFSPHWRWR